MLERSQESCIVYAVTTKWVSLSVELAGKNRSLSGSDVLRCSQMMQFFIQFFHSICFQLKSYCLTPLSLKIY